MELQSSVRKLRPVEYTPPADDPPAPSHDATGDVQMQDGTTDSTTTTTTGAIPVAEGASLSASTSLDVPMHDTPARENDTEAPVGVNQDNSTEALTKGAVDTMTEDAKEKPDGKEEMEESTVAPTQSTPSRSTRTTKKSKAKASPTVQAQEATTMTPASTTVASEAKEGDGAPTVSPPAALTANAVTGHPSPTPTTATNASQVESCPACTPETREQMSTSRKESWIQCDHCSTWHHWRCAGNGEDVEMIAKWYVKNLVCA